MAGEISIDAMQIEITASAESASSKIDNLVGSLKTLRSTLAGLGTGKQGAKLAQGLGQLKQTIGDLGGLAGKLKNVSDAISGLQKMGDVKISSTIGKNLESIATACDGFTSEKISNLERAADALKKMDGVNVGSLRQAASRTAPTVSTAPADSGTSTVASEANRVGAATDGAAERVSKLSSALNALKSVAGGAASKLWGVSKSALKIGGNLLAAPFKSALSSMKAFSTKLSNIGSAFKRILFYRAIRALIKEITQAVKEGINNLYQWSAAFGGEFAGSMDRAATSLQYFKNSIGASLAPLINALVPILDAIIDRVVALINVINQLFAKLAGATYWTRAVKSAKQYGEATGGAAKAMKKLKDYTLGFDELNVFNDNAGSGGGGGASVPDYGSMFENVDVFDNGVSDFADKFKGAIRNGDWAGAGKLLASKVNGVFASVKWNTLGKKIGKGVNGVIATAYNFLQNVDFRAIGRDIADWLNGALSEIDFTNLGGLLVRKFTMLWDTVLGFVDKLDWKQLGKKISEYLRGIFDNLSNWLDSVNWEQLGSDLWTKFKQLIEGLDVKILAKSLFNMLWKVVKAAWGLLKGAVKGIWDDIENEVFKPLADWFDKNVVQPISDFFTDLWNGVASLAEDAWESVKEAFRPAITWFDRNVIQPVSKFFSGLWDDVSGWASDAWEDIKRVFDTVYGWLDRNVIQPVKKLFSNLWQAIKDGAQYAWDFVKGVASGFGQSIFGGGISITVDDYVKKKTGLIQSRASGGYVESGQMFLARENGIPEMVGRIGNQTAVANNGQIEEGIARATERGSEGTIRALYAVAAQLVRAIEDNTMTVNIGDDEIGRANDRYTARRGTNTTKGAFANAW